MDLSGFWNSKKIQLLFYGYILIAVAIGLQSVLLGLKTFNNGSILYTQYNNYVIFKYAYLHLVEHKDLYQLYPAEYWDLYKYSPAFALFFGLFAWLPDPVGLILWNLLNIILFFTGIKLLPRLNDNRKSWILLFCLPELILSTQNSQSNALIAGLIIIAFTLLERSKFFLAALCIVFTVYIKIFGVVAFALFLFYPGKIKLAFYTVFWMFLLAILPIVVVDFNQLLFLYKSWLHLLANDHSVSIGLSAMGILQSWFRLVDSKNIVMLAGILLFCIPLFHISRFKDFHFRILVLSSILLWIVIFNHKAESSTFIIAMSGIGAWYFSQQKNTLNLVLLVLAFIFTALVSTDLCPGFLKEKFIKPYDIKALFPLIIWLKITFDLISLRYTPITEAVSSA